MRGYYHQFNEREDLIRNSSPSEVIQRRGKWDYLRKLERERREKEPSFKGCVSIFKMTLLG